MNHLSPIPLRRQRTITLATCVPQTGGIAVSGDVTFVFAVPSVKLHFDVSVVVTPPDILSITGSTWKLTPQAGPSDDDPSAPNPPGNTQPVINNGPLPDGYEGASSTRLWKADCHLVLVDSGLSNRNGRIVATVSWEPVPSAIQMTDEERAYWFGLCNFVQIPRPLVLGSGIP